MNRKPTSRPSRFLPLLTLCATLAFSGLALAHETPPAPGTPAPAPTATAPAPPTPAPTPAPAPGATAPAPIRREEEDPAAPGNPQATAQPSIFERAAALMKGKDGLAAEIASLKATVADRDKTISAHVATIAGLNAELGTLRAGKQSLESAVAAMETQRTDVAATVAALGIPAGELPAAEPVEAAGESAEGLLASFRAEQDPAKKADLFAQFQAKQAQAGKKS